MSAEEPKPAATPEAKTGGPGPDRKAAGPKPEATTTDSQPETSAVATPPGAKVIRPRMAVGNKVIFSLAIIGILAGLVAAYLFGVARKAQPPVFQPVTSPFETAIYANGIVESDQPSGANVNICPEVSGPITSVLVQEGQAVSAGTVLFTIEDSVQRANTEQLRLQSEASLALLSELKAQPRAETLAIASAQVRLGEANLKVARDQYDKRRVSYEADPKSITLDVLDTAQDTVDQATAALVVARRQLDLTQAGAWSYDVVGQEKQSQALQQAYQAAAALLQKYSVRAPITGVVLAVNAAVGSYVSSQGAYDAYTQGFDQLVVMGAPQDHMDVRCYVDEILVSRLPSGWHMRAQMQITGTELKLPLEFVRVQPYVSPKIELSNERQEQVDLRVLPVIFRFEKKDAPVYPGQMVDVYIGQQ